MVFHKRLDHGSGGYQAPPMPRVPSFARGKRSARRKVEEKQMCAFDLLATVAGELLSERENSSIPHKGAIKEHLGNEKPFKAEVFNQGSCNRSTLGSEKLEIGMETSPETERGMIGSVIDRKGPEILEDRMDVGTKTPALIRSDSSIEVPIPRNASFPKHSGDDKENSSGCTHPRIDTSKVFRPQRTGDRRIIQKMSASKFWKVAPMSSKDEDLTNSEVKAVCRNRKLCYTRQRTQRCSFKRRKLFERRSMSASDMDIYNEANVAASFTTSGQKSYESRDYHVKLRIKSFKVPELFIEIPENATVGSLKRTVMEAVATILGGGLRVGVLLQGKKVRDDNKTLLQAGIAHNDKIDNLGFALEPNSTPTPPPLLCPQDPDSIIPIDAIEQLPTVPPNLELLSVSEVTPQACPMSTVNCSESYHDSVHSPTDALSSIDKTADSKALVPVPPTNVEALAVVPLRKSRHTELVQRRIRRPFSVSEVEALVQAVEKLGTGRWRDVKLRAFDNAKHRTYVDLKDKWKTLVHTARISPQQRRGEPVPQELLDRVLSAHDYWSRHQQAKPPSSDRSLLATKLTG